MRKHIGVKAVLLVGTILFSDICCLTSRAALRGGCAKVDITPPVGVWLSGYRAREKPSDGICDGLYARALVLDDGQNKIAIISADLLWVPSKITTQVRGIVKEKIGIPDKNILICATHTHFGPKIDRIAKNWPDTPVSEWDSRQYESCKIREKKSSFTDRQSSGRRSFAKNSICFHLR